MEDDDKYEATKVDKNLQISLTMADNYGAEKMLRKMRLTKRGE